MPEVIVIILFFPLITFLVLAPMPPGKMGFTLIGVAFALWLLHGWYVGNNPIARSGPLDVRNAVRSETRQAVLFAIGVAGVIQGVLYARRDDLEFKRTTTIVVGAVITLFISFASIS